VVVPIGSLLLAIHFAIGSQNRSIRILEAICVFIAFFFLLIGFRLLIGNAGDDALFGSALASMSLTFFWLMLRKQR
jgi:hypothetical protein